MLVNPNWNIQNSESTNGVKNIALQDPNDATYAFVVLGYDNSSGSLSDEQLDKFAELFMSDYYIVPAEKPVRNNNTLICSGVSGTKSIIFDVIPTKDRVIVSALIADNIDVLDSQTDNFAALVDSILRLN